MGFARLAFTPQSKFVYQQSNGAAYVPTSLPIPRDMYARRLYVLLNGGTNFLVNARITFTLSGRVVYQIPYIVGPTTGATFWLRLPGGVQGTTNPGAPNSLSAQFGTTTTTVHPWNLTIAADNVSLSILSSTVVASAQQLIAVESQHKW